MNEHDTGSVSAPTGARDPGQRRTKIRRALVALVASLVAILVVAAGPASPASAFSWRSEWRVGGTSGWTSANVAPAAVGYGPNFRMITAPGFTFARNGSVGVNDFQRYLVTFDLYAGYSTNNMTLYAHRTFDSFFNPGQGALTFSGVVLDYYASRGNYYRWGVTVLWFDIQGNLAGRLTVNSDRASDFRCNAVGCVATANGSVLT